MTYEEAIRIIQTAIAEVEWEYPMEYAVAFETAIAAIEKQIPKTPNSGIDRTWGTPTKEAICPVCDCALGHWEFIGDAKKITYCEHCGQAITWEG